MKDDDIPIVFFPHDEVFVWTMIGIIVLVVIVVAPISSWYYERKYNKPKSRQ